MQPDTILPEQLSDRPFGGARIQPEKRLQVAVLADAVLTFHRWAAVERARARCLFAEVEAWFASEDADGPPSASSPSATRSTSTPPTSAGDSGTGTRPWKPQPS